MSRAGDRHRAKKKRCLALKRWREFYGIPEIRCFLEIYRAVLELECAYAASIGVPVKSVDLTAVVFPPPLAKLIYEAHGKL